MSSMPYEYLAYLIKHTFRMHLDLSVIVGNDSFFFRERNGYVVSRQANQFLLDTLIGTTDNIILLHISQGTPSNVSGVVLLTGDTNCLHLLTPDITNNP